MPQMSSSRQSGVREAVRVLVACEFSGTVRDAFRARGHDAWSCDILPTEAPGPHYQCDVREVLGMGWDMMVAHPPCTYLTRAGAAYYGQREAERKEALDFFNLLWTANIPKRAIENPPPFADLFERCGRNHQTVNPFEFGDSQRKAICLWLKNLPPLFASVLCCAEPKAVYIRKTGAKAGQKYRAYFHNGKNPHERSRFFPSVARAMAEQWG